MLNRNYVTFTTIGALFFLPGAYLDGVKEPEEYYKLTKPKSFYDDQGQYHIPDAELLPSVNETTNTNIEYCKFNSKSGTLEKYLQPDDLASGNYDENIQKDRTPENLCARICKAGEPSKICYYKFYVERYVTMSLACKDCPNKIEDCNNDQCIIADGYEREVLSVNRKIPGPLIQVCENDLIVVDVKNLMAGSSTGIHWHGIRQLNTGYMDGVPMLTQCPILENQVFRYFFQPSEHGTFFWHSHSGLQKVDGMVGGLIVKGAITNKNRRQYYDYPSNVIVVQDWMNETADALFPGVRKRREGQNPDSFLINGRGMFVVKNDAGDIISANYGKDFGLLSKFKIKRGKHFVYRIIAGTCLICPFRFQIQDHDMVVLAADGKELLHPKLVDSVVLSAGERYTVLVNGKHANASKHYWIHVNSTGFCSLLAPNLASQVALLEYDDPDLTDEVVPISQPLPKKLSLGETNIDCSIPNPGKLCYNNLNSVTVPPPEIVKNKPDYRFVLGFDFHEISPDIAFQKDSHLRFSMLISRVPIASVINGIANTFPSSPLLTQHNDVPKCTYCNSVNPFSNWANLQECLHVFKVSNFPSVVEIILMDSSNRVIEAGNLDNMAHPIHLHGYDQYLVEQGAFKAGKRDEELQKLIDKLDSPHYKIDPNPLLKDTYQMSEGTYVVLRIYADNPGYWLAHCHFAYHLDTGMSAIFQVGNPEDHPKPPPGFPTCNNFLPQPNFDNVKSEQSLLAIFEGPNTIFSKK